MKSPEDATLGRLAVGRGFITPAQLEEALAEQEKSEGVRKPLGVLLVAKGLIRPDDLVELLNEQDRIRRVVEAYADRRRRGLLFGQLLVQNNYSTQNQVNKCLELQKAMADQGRKPVPRLGELLVEHGYVDRQAVAETLKLQDKDLLLCPACGRQFNVVGTQAREMYRCVNCGGMLARPIVGEIRAEETRFGFELHIRKE